MGDIKVSDNSSLEDEKEKWIIYNIVTNTNLHEFAGLNLEAPAKFDSYSKEYMALRHRHSQEDPRVLEFFVKPVFHLLHALDDTLQVTIAC